MDRKIVYWDTAAFLALLNKDADDPGCESCEDVWNVCENGLMSLVTSTLTIAEVIHLKGTPKLDPSKRPLINSFFRASHIIQKPLTRAIAELARDVVWDSGIMPKDAIHIATAAYYKVGVFHTFDRGLLDKGNVVIGGFDMAICKPHAQRQVELLLRQLDF
jgi:predicted nucleic acid-binding protein